MNIKTEQDAEEERAIKALIKWRREWEKRYATPPAPSGFGIEAPLWKHAGIAMKRRGIKSRFATG